MKGTSARLLHTPLTLVNPLAKTTEKPGLDQISIFIAGLGKTFIAAVVMYNFYRWYPQGKILFMAPTKPLVAQQIEACYNVMGIPQEHTAQMTGIAGLCFPRALLV